MLFFVRVLGEFYLSSYVLGLFFFEQKTAYDMRISSWSSDVCSSDLDFSTFPTVLLLSTLFRLALSIATTRMILTHAEAGHIVEQFGQMVAGGNLIVGLVVFLIITVVQFIVISKGAERVAGIGRASCRARGCQSVEIRVVADSL